MEATNRGDGMTWSRETYPKKEKIARSEEKDLSIPDLTYTTRITCSSKKCERSEEWWWMCDYRFSTNVDMSCIFRCRCITHRLKKRKWGVSDLLEIVVVVIVAVIVSLSVPLPLPLSVGYEERNLVFTPARAMEPWSFWLADMHCVAADKPHHTHTFMSKYRVIIG